MKLFHTKYFLSLENYKIYAINKIKEAKHVPTLKQILFLERALYMRAVVAIHLT